MPQRCTGLLALLLLTVPLAVVGQTPDHFLSLHGRVLDTLTGRGVPRTRVCSWTPGVGSQANGLFARCAQPDSLGAFTLDSIPSTWESIQVTCETQGYFAHILATRRARTDSLASGPWELRTSSAGCDPRPFKVVVGTFTGLYRAEFELSELRRCDAPGERAWVTFSKAALDAYYRLFPAPLPADSGDLLLTIHGTLSGPAHLGHMGVFAYEIVADTVLAMVPGGRCP
jgi:hypothetical protein